MNTHFNFFRNSSEVLKMFYCSLFLQDERNRSLKNNLQMMKRGRGSKKGIVSSFKIFASQCALVEDFILAAGNQSWMTFVAKEEAVWISGNGKAWERPKTGSRRSWVDLGWAFKTDYRFGVARLQQHIGPVASVNFFVVDQTLGAGKLVGDSVLALDVTGGALWAVFVYSKLIFTAGCRDCGCYEEFARLL